MLSYLKVENIDNELIEFHLRQKNYYSLEGQVVTREYLMINTQLSWVSYP